MHGRPLMRRAAPWAPRGAQGGREAPSVLACPAEGCGVRVCAQTLRYVELGLPAAESAVRAAARREAVRAERLGREEGSGESVEGGGES